MRIMVVGCKKIGCSIAEILITNNHEVILNGIDEKDIESGVISICKSMEEKVLNEKLNDKDKNDILKKLSATPNLKEALNCDLVIEAISENIGNKKNLFNKLDNVCKKQTILVSTSSLSIDDIASSTNRADKVIGVNFLLDESTDLVEVTNSNVTSNETKELIFKLLKDIKKTPVSVDKIEA